MDVYGGRVGKIEGDRVGNSRKFTVSRFSLYGGSLHPYLVV